MFHQVLIRKADQDAQRFLWSSSLEPEAVPDEYVMQVMTFGARCSPSISQLVKNRNAEEFRAQFPEATEAIIKNHYVDDLLYSNDNHEDIIRIAKEIVYIHQEGGFEMRGFVSNSQEVMNGLGGSPETFESVKVFKTEVDSPDANEMVFLIKT